MTMQTASGARELNPEQVKSNYLIASKLSSLYHLWGYEQISPPHLERIETLMAAGGISQNEILKIVADEPIGLRPEMTASIVRASSTRFKKFERPLRFYSTGNSFKCNRSLDGGIDIEETMQSGIEIIGTKGIKAEIELLTLLIESLKTIKSGRNYETTLLIGNTYIMDLILSSFDNKRTNEINKILGEIDLVRLNQCDIDLEQKKLIKKIINLRGNPETVLHTIKNIYGTSDYIEKFEELFSYIIPLSNTENINIQFDPTLQTKYNLYSGITFELISYISDTPIVLAKGGRYDALVQKFNNNETNSYGVGFSFSIDKLRELTKNSSEVKTNKDKILIAYKNNNKFNVALKHQKELHNKGIVSIIEYEPIESKEFAFSLLKVNRCTKLKWIE